VKKRWSRRRSSFPGFPGVSVFLDDIEEVIGILGEGGNKVSISDDEYEFDSLEEFINKRGKSPRVLALGKPGRSVEFRRFTGLVLDVGRSAEHDATYFRLWDLLERRRTFRSRILYPPFWWSVFLVMLGLSLPAPTGSIVGSRELFRASMTCCLVALLSLPLFNLSRINLARRHEATTSWSRNLEVLIAGAIGALIGGVGVAVGERLLHLK